MVPLSTARKAEYVEVIGDTDTGYVPLQEKITELPESLWLLGLQSTVRAAPTSSDRVCARWRTLPAGGTVCNSGRAYLESSSSFCAIFSLLFFL